MKHFQRQRKDWIAVLGGALEFSEEQVYAAYDIGTEIAGKGKGLVTGATTGIPYAAVLGAKNAKGLVVGISPAANPEEHIKHYQKPLDYTDFIVYTGAGNDCRSTFIVNSASAAIFIGGEIGTLKEFASAWQAGNKIIGILTGFGGITDHLEELAQNIKTGYNNRLVVEPDPHKLVHRIVNEIQSVEENIENHDLARNGNGSRIKKMIRNRK